MFMFKKENFDLHGGYLTYDMNNGEHRKFVARFKYGGGSGSFKTFLIKNFTPVEYFNRLESVPSETPLAILESKGYMTPMAKKACKDIGLNATPENYKTAIKAKVADAMAFRANMAIS